ncbi:uncharacterized protein LOC110450939 [Mizuhopecten yessoensis]|uniref:uncharacterized protein LOC110450939 n=1 Tax=Mizuhopecten yessoensis TaxID=6573 RepID=UPI000B45B2EE|nr:uncharacterized protein LOC110450939 [Mizuhopecten yessoensis]
MQSNYAGPIAVTEKYPTGYLNISEKQKVIFDITMLIGTSSVCLPLIIKLPSSGMMNMFLAQIGVYVAIPDVTGFIQWEITHVVISSLVFPIISGLLSVAVFFGIKKLILSKNGTL